MSTVSILVPSRNEPLLPQTVNGLFEKATGEIEVIVVLDGRPHNPPLHEERPNLKVLRNDESVGMRRAVNQAASMATGDYLMKVDAHCLFAEGFDEVLKADYEDNWVVIPRRYRLDPERWSIAEDGKIPVDYQYLIYPRKYSPPELHGFRWDARSIERKDILIDETLTFQGSCWFMKKEHFARNHFLTVEGYGGLPQQEAEEIGLTTWMSGGKVMTNKKTYYAHLHKNKDRFYHLARRDMEMCYAFSYHHWVKEHWKGFCDVIDHFSPLPGWPSNWKEKL